MYSLKSEGEKRHKKGCNPIFIEWVCNLSYLTVCHGLFLVTYWLYDASTLSHYRVNHRIYFVTPKLTLAAQPLSNFSPYNLNA